MTVRRRTVVGIAAVLLLTGGAFMAGVMVADAGQAPRHPALLTGADWSTFGFREKQLYVSGFIAGAAAEQVRALAAQNHTATDSASLSSRAIAALRDGKALDYAYAPSVYASQIDDFYWWTDHVSTPIVDVMISTNRRMKQE